MKMKVKMMGVIVISMSNTLLSRLSSVVDAVMDVIDNVRKTSVKRSYYGVLCIKKNNASHLKSGTASSSRHHKSVSTPK